jgi:hypothetical protein
MEQLVVAEVPRSNVYHNQGLDGWSAPVVVGTPAGFQSFRDRDYMKIRDDKILASLHDQAYVLCMLWSRPQAHLSSHLHPSS